MHYLFFTILGFNNLCYSGKKATEGITLRNIKLYLEKNFKRNITNKKFLKSLTDNINESITRGQLVRTSIGKGAALSVTLNLHFNPDDTRGEDIMDEIKDYN